MPTADPHMISDAALEARYDDATTIAHLMADDEARSTYERRRDAGQERLRSFLLATKRGFYRESDEYRRAELDARMARKPRPTSRPMAGHGSRSYRSW